TEKELLDKGVKVIASTCDVGNSEELHSFLNRVKDQFGTVDILINNAATNPYFGEMLGADDGVWDKTFDVNLKGPFFITQHAARLMDDSGGGAIVNVSSINGVKPALFQGIYSMTKAGIISMTKAFAKELAPKNIRVNAILPGLVDTHFSQAIMNNEMIYEYAIKMIPMARHAVPREIAGAVIYLVSDAASFTTGACFVVDGGALA
ncbi:MAG: SDR family oxidoreductase, partial [Desulfomonilia bacterium]|nr:SDR family oxidoreductase [Desulfomonilia bacterium]